MEKVGLILEGGANRGIFTSGVTDCLKENNLYLPYIISVSVGTCNAIDYVSKQIGLIQNWSETITGKLSGCTAEHDDSYRGE